jgi:hypothetical protein
MPPTNVQFSRLYDQYGGLVFRDLLRRSQNESLAVDLLPRIFARAFRTWDGWSGRGTRLLWLMELSVREAEGAGLVSGMEEDADEWLLERSVAGDLSKPESRRLRDRLDEDPGLESRLSSLRKDDVDFERRFPWSELEPKVKAAVAERVSHDEVVAAGRRSSERRYVRAISLGVFLGVAATLGLLTFGPKDEPSILPLIPSVHQGQEAKLWPADSKQKRGTLQAFVFSGGRPQLLEQGASVEPSTRLQFRVKSEEMYLAMLGVDAEGTITTYVPARGERSVAWTPGPAQPLGTSLEASTVRGDEVFCAFLSSSPLDLVALRAEVESRLAASEDFVGSLQALQETPEPLANEIGLVHIQKP